MRIAHVTSSDLSVRFLLLNQLVELQKAGFEVAVVCGEGPWAAEVCTRGLQVFTVPMRREVSLADDLRALKALIRLFRQERFDVVHTHTPKAGLLGPLAARLVRAPHVVHTVHGLLFHDRMPLFRRLPFILAEAATGRFVDHLLFQSREDMTVATRWRIASPTRIHYQGNGIDVHRFDPARIPAERRLALRREWGFPADAFVIGMVGRLVREKGYEEFFAAADALSPRWPHVRFLVVGPVESDQRDTLNIEAECPPTLRPRLHWLGMRLDMPELYSTMDVFVLPSYREGIPRALMEASAMGLPVVASDIRGCREVVVAGQTGLLVPPRDPVALAVAIEAVIKHPTEAKAMGQAGRAHILAHFDEAQVVDRLITFYRNVLGAEGRSRSYHDPTCAHR